jgi:transcriptional regulator with XRE-family HTH domain
MTGKELRAIRDKLVLSQAEFAERLKISRVSVTRMEWGTQVITPSMALLIELLANEIERERASKRAADTPGDEGKRVGGPGNLRVRRRKQQDSKKDSRRRGS